MNEQRTLQGIKVVELSNYVAAPVCARMLGDLGAEVIKIEGMKGDPWRQSGKANTFTDDEENPVYDIYNTGKKSIRLNIKHPDGMRVLMELLADADVFITNTRAPSLKKLGLDYDTLSRKFPRLIYGTITGYGEKGPQAADPGFDTVAFWTRSGFLLDMSIKTDGSYPVYPPVGAGDTYTGTVLFSGVLAALYQREKTGKGDYVTAALQNAGMWFMASMLIQSQEKYHIKFPKERPNCSPFSSAYKCADGEWLSLTILDMDRYRVPALDILGITEELAPLNITTSSEMKAKSELVIPVMERAFLKKTAAEWQKLFKEADIVCGILNHMSDAMVNEQAVVNEFVQEYTCHNGEKCLMPCPPVRLASQPVPKSGFTPLAGEDTVEVLERMGYSAQDIDRMMTDGAVG